MASMRRLLPGESLAGKLQYDRMVIRLASRYAAATGQAIEAIKVLPPAAQDRIRREANKRKVEMAQVKKQEYVDQIPDPEGSRTSPSAPSARFTSRRTSTGTTVGGIKKTTNEELFLGAATEQEKQMLASQKELERLHRKLIGSGKQTEVSRRATLKALHDYVFWISKAFMIEGNIQTSTELLKIISGIKAQSDAAVLAAFEKGLMEQMKEVSRIQLYIQAMRLLQQRKVYLFVNDIGLLEANNNMNNILNSVSFQVGNQIEKLIYPTLLEAFEEAWKGLSVDAFPIAYRNRIINQINYAKSRKLVQVSGSLKQRGFYMSSWQILADFETIFGDKADFELGYHYGAFIGDNPLKYKTPSINTESGGGLSSKFNQQVRLPYLSQNLRNPVAIRYAYWLAMWKDAKFFSPTFGLDRKTHSGETKKRLLTLNKRKEALEKKLDEQRDQQVKAMLGVTQPRRDDAWERQQYINVIDNTRQEIDDINDRIKYVERAISYSSKYKKTQPRKIRNAREQKLRTIQARVAYWRSINKAPMWILLEYGQLAYEPRIPPRGVYFRFITKMQKKIRELVRQAQNATASKYYGYTVGPTGRRTVTDTPQSGEEVIQFWLNPDVRGYPFKPGELLPADRAVYRRITIARKATKRTVDEAARIGADVTAARALMAASQAAADKARAEVSRAAGKIPVVPPPPKVTPRGLGRPMKYYTSETRVSPTARLERFRRVLDAPHIGSSISSGRTLRSVSEPSYQPAPLSAYMSREDYETYSRLPNKGLQRAYLKKKMAKKRSR